MPPKENKTSVSTVSLGGLLTVFDTVDLVVLSIKKNNEEQCDTHLSFCCLFVCLFYLFQNNDSVKFKLNKTENLSSENLQNKKKLLMTYFC